MSALNLSANVGANVLNFSITSTSRVQRLVAALGKLIGVWDPSRLRIQSRSGLLRDRDDRTLEEAGIRNGDKLFIMFEMTGGYCADGLYFASPTEIPQLTLEIALSPGLAADEIFKPGHGWSQDLSRVIEWSGSVSNERGYGSFSALEERDSGRKDRAVTWGLRLDTEASPASEYFVLNDANSVVLAFKDVASYLENTLESFSLDENAILRFSMKYLERLISSNYVAIRFLEQAMYEQLAPLSVSPPPEVVTRVVMLFQVLSEADVTAWGGARERSQLGPSYWKDVIGFDGRATDASLYRALEWRVMEIPAAGAAA